MPDKSAPACPECGKPIKTDFAPFCSVRCQQIDLGRWMKGEFVIPGPPQELGIQPGDVGPAQPPDNDDE
jgi:endogenous inhibitor of DNA gyrase (YacG/DUF329 family)